VDEDEGEKDEEEEEEEERKIIERSRFRVPKTRPL